MARTVLIVAFSALVGCVTPTRFHGGSRVPNGPAGCKAVCDGWGMELAGMVQMGEYSDGCICQVKNPAGSSSSAVGPSTAGVYLQMLAAAEEQQRRMQEASPHIPGHPHVPGSPVGSPGWRPGLP